MPQGGHREEEPHGYPLFAALAGTPNVKLRVPGKAGAQGQITCFWVFFGWISKCSAYFS